MKLPKKYSEVLLICYAYPPYQAIGSVRSANISKELRKYFKKVHIITTRNIDKKLIRGDDKSISRLVTFDYDVLRKIIRKIKPKTNSKLTSTPITKSNKVPLFTKFINTFPLSIIFGLGGLFYILHGIIIAIKRANNNTVIYSSFSPVSDHIIAWAVKKRYPKAYWIADYRDAFLMPGEPASFAPKIETRIHKRLMKRADQTTVVSFGLKNHFQNYTSKVSVIRNSSVLTKNPDYLSPVVTAKFKIVYTGRLYQNKRNPTPLFEAIEELLNEGAIKNEKLEVIHAGSESSFWNNHANKYSFNNIDLGLVSREKARNLQIHSNILLMMNWNLPNLLGTLSGKLFEYFEIGNPILAIIDGQDDKELNEIFEDLNAGIVTYKDRTDISIIKDFVLKYYKLWLKDSMSAKVIDREKLKTYSWEHVVKEFLKTTDVK